METCLRGITVTLTAGKAGCRPMGICNGSAHLKLLEIKLARQEGKPWEQALEGTDLGSREALQPGAPGVRLSAQVLPADSGGADGPGPTPGATGPVLQHTVSYEDLDQGTCTPNQGPFQGCAGTSGPWALSKSCMPMLLGLRGSQASI